MNKFKQIAAILMAFSVLSVASIGASAARDISDGPLGTDPSITTENTSESNFHFIGPDGITRATTENTTVESTQSTTENISATVETTESTTEKTTEKITESTTEESTTTLNESTTQKEITTQAETTTKTESTTETTAKATDTDAPSTKADETSKSDTTNKKDEEVSLNKPSDDKKSDEAIEAKPVKDTTTKKSEIPDTGSKASLAVFAALGAMATAAITVLKKRSQKNNTPA